MKSTELRIGNLVNGVLTNKPYTIDSWALREMENGNYQNSYDTETKVFVPIPLTEEWLLNFGFEKVSFNNDFRIDILNDWGLIYDSDIKKICIDTGLNSKYLEIQYVHQLQNLYFALCGEELTFKSK